MKNHYFTLILFLYSQISFSQDILTKINGDDFQVKVLEVNENTIRFKKFSDLEGPDYVLNRSSVHMIRYENGKKDIFRNEDVSDISVLKKDTLSSHNFALMGQKDAQMFYNGTRSGAGWVAATSGLVNPVIGLIPAVLCAKRRPNDVNLNMKSYELSKNSIYYNAYINEAKKIKRKKVWTGFGIGTGVYAVLLIISNSMK